MAGCHAPVPYSGSDQIISDSEAEIAPLWHDGEIILQKHLGVHEIMMGFGKRCIHDHIPAQHGEFYRELPFIIAGAVDPSGNAWATLLTGDPGFVHSPDPKKLDVEYARSVSDPADVGMEDGAAVGILGIALQSRRRNRANGKISRHDNGGFSVNIETAFGNCPRYIQKRHQGAGIQQPAGACTVEKRGYLDDADRALIGQADTFFVATYVDIDGQGRQIDVSHRGGNAGFVRIDQDGVLTIPDFAGNRFFNTLGNILLNDRTGLLFVDFATGTLLQLSGSAELILDAPIISEFKGAERIWRFKPEHIVRRGGILPANWHLDEYSPHLAGTGK